MQLRLRKGHGGESSHCARWSGGREPLSQDTALPRPPPGSGSPVLGVGVGGAGSEPCPYCSCCPEGPPRGGHRLGVTRASPTRRQCSVPFQKDLHESSPKNCEETESGHCHGECPLHGMETGSERGAQLLGLGFCGEGSPRMDRPRGPRGTGQRACILGRKPGAKASPSGSAPGRQGGFRGRQALWAAPQRVAAARAQAKDSDLSPLAETALVAPSRCLGHVGRGRRQAKQPRSLGFSIMETRSFCFLYGADLDFQHPG